MRKTSFNLQTNCFEIKVDGVIVRNKIHIEKILARLEYDRRTKFWKWKERAKRKEKSWLETKRCHETLHTIGLLPPLCWSIAYNYIILQGIHSMHEQKSRLEDRKKTTDILFLNISDISIFQTFQTYHFFGRHVRHFEISDILEGPKSLHME